MAAQDQALRTNSIKRIIDKQNVSAKCRMFGEGDETVSHIVSECKKLTQKQYPLSMLEARQGGAGDSLGSLRIDDFCTTTPLDCVTYLLRMPIWALAGVATKSTTLVRAICRRLGNSRT